MYSYFINNGGCRGGDCHAREGVDGSLDAGRGAESIARSRTASAIRDAKAQGYEGDACPECSAMTMVRNGTCLKCMTCGGTSGCS